MGREIDEDLAELHRMLAVYTNPQCHFGFLSDFNYEKDIEVIIDMIEAKKQVRSVLDWWLVEP